MRINDRSLRVFERLSQDLLSLSLSSSLPFLTLLSVSRGRIQQSPHVVISDIQLIFQLVCSYIAAVVASYYSIKSFPLPPSLPLPPLLPFAHVPSHSRSLLVSSRGNNRGVERELLSRCGCQVSRKGSARVSLFSLYFSFPRSFSFPLPLPSLLLSLFSGGGEGGGISIVQSLSSMSSFPFFVIGNFTIFAILFCPRGKETLFSLYIIAKRTIRSKFPN